MIQGSLECCWRAPAAHATSLFSGSVTSTEALYNAPPFGALRDDSWGAVTMGRFARRLGPLLFGIPGGGTWDMGHGTWLGHGYPGASPFLLKRMLTHTQREGKEQSDSSNLDR